MAAGLLRLDLDQYSTLRTGYRDAAAHLNVTTHIDVDPAQERDDLIYNDLKYLTKN